jgi:16S rRNA (uracil1498-N3)-methyltransferase
MAVRITRVFHGSMLAAGEEIRLSGEEAHHAVKVLRARPGDNIEVVDAGGRLWLAELSGGREAVVLEERPTGLADEGAVTLYQAVPKGRHMDLVVEKATELGVGRVVPLATERGVVKLSGGDAKVERWRRVAVSAARQSLRLRVPEVGEPLAFSEAVREVGEAGVLLHVGPELAPVEEVVMGGPVGLFVGPEGGWSEGELALAEGAGLRFASLGPFRLRSETAGVVAVARAEAALERTGSMARSR